MPVLALRINFVGELGWELHHPVEYQIALYEALRGAGRDLGLVDFGLRAMDSLRLEKAYRSWGADINTEVTPLEAGLERFVAFDKGDFVGRAALLEQRRAGLRKRLATLEVDATDADCWGSEAVWAGDRVVGITTSGGYAHWLGLSLAVAYLDAEVLGAGHPAGGGDPGRAAPGQASSSPCSTRRTTGPAAEPRAYVIPAREIAVDMKRTTVLFWRHAERGRDSPGDPGPCSRGRHQGGPRWAHDRRLGR